MRDMAVAICSNGLQTMNGIIYTPSKIIVVLRQDFVML